MPVWPVLAGAYAILVRGSTHPTWRLTPQAFQVAQGSGARSGSQEHSQEARPALWFSDGRELGSADRFRGVAARIEIYWCARNNEVNREDTVCAGHPLRH